MKKYFGLSEAAVKMFINVCMAFVLVSVLVSCGDGRAPKKKSNEETMNSGKLQVWVDESLYNLMEPTFKMFNKFNPDVELTITRSGARDVMAQLLGGKARAIIIGREYLRDEDSLMKVYKVPVHKSMDIATDALALFGWTDYQLDTINAAQVYKALTEKNYSLKSQFPKLTEEPVFVTCGTNSSEWANINKLILKGKKAERRIITFPTFDSVKSYVRNHKNAIGIGFNANIYRNLDFKAIMVGYTDSTGKYINPKPVHQAYVLQGLYPYTVTFRVLLLEDRKDLPFWFGMFVSREAVVTKYLKEAGVVPSYAKFVLTRE